MAPVPQPPAAEVAVAARQLRRASAPQALSFRFAFDFYPQMAQYPNAKPLERCCRCRAQLAERPTLDWLRDWVSRDWDSLRDWALARMTAGSKPAARAARAASR